MQLDPYWIFTLFNVKYVNVEYAAYELLEIYYDILFNTHCKTFAVLITVVFPFPKQMEAD